MTPGYLDCSLLLMEFDSIREIAELAGVSRRTVERWLEDGLPPHQADLVACRLLNRPTAYLWPEAMAVPVSEGNEEWMTLDQLRLDLSA